MALRDDARDAERAAPRADGAASQFELRERERHRRRQERYDAAMPLRERSAERHAYYHAEVRELVRRIVMPDSRVLEVGCGLGDLLAGLDAREAVGIDLSRQAIEAGRQRHPGLDLRVADVERDPLPEGPFDAIVLSGSVGQLDDVQLAFERLRSVLAPDGRLIVTYYNFVWEPVLKLGEAAGYKAKWPDQNWLSMTDIENLLELADFEVVRRGTDVLLPVDLPLVAPAANRVAAKLPGVRHLALVDYFVARAAPAHLPAKLPSVSVICPCKDERGNIREAVARTPLMGPRTELIFVDGNSQDGTVEEIEAVIREHRGPVEIRLLPQGPGKGKGDAVRKGFAAARCDVLMILDSDLTVPPEDLPKFYRALVAGKGDFINGVRLVYPMEGEAMRFLNLLGNKFFSSALSWLLEQPIKDSLCGTKVLFGSAYQQIAKNRDFFGDFDPFGDFDLLFGAARANLRIRDLPVRYRARTYGDTKISRFTHGWQLAKMTAFGFRKLRMGL